MSGFFVLLRLSSHGKQLAFLFVNPLSPPVCPSCPVDNTILKGLDIISRFFRYSASAINFGRSLHKVLCNVFFRRLFFWPLLANGSGGRSLVAGAAVDIHMLMKGALRSAPAVGVGPQQTQTVPTVGWVGGTTATTRTCPKGLGESRGHVQFVSYCTAWFILIVNIIGFVISRIILGETEQIYRPSGVTYSNLDAHFLLLKMKVIDQTKNHQNRNTDGKLRDIVAFIKSPHAII